MIFITIWKSIQPRSHFDFSNFPRDHKLFDRLNEKQVLKVKDELAWTHWRVLCIKTKFIFNSCQWAEQENEKICTVEAQPWDVQTNSSKRQFSLARKMKLNSERHQIQTVCVNKIAFGAYDDKKYIMEDKKGRLPFGHYLLTDDFVSKPICSDTEWCFDSNDSEESVSVFGLQEGA